MRPLRTLTAALTLALAATALSADVVTDWNTVLLDAVRTDRTNPPRMTRNSALSQVAVYDAVAGILGGFEPYLVTSPAPAGASPEAAAAAAAHRVLVAVYPAQQATFDAVLAASLAAVPDGPPKVDGIAWGEQVADAVLASRADDGAGQMVPYESAVGANWWIPTPPAFAPPLLPNWPLVTPWCMTHGGQFRQPAPPPLASTEYRSSFREVKRFGDADSTFRSADQSEIALFWNDGPGTNTPPGHWQQIGQIVADAQGNTLLDNARLFALLALTQADAAIASWDNKYHWNHWRPVTGIHEADTDGNPDTAPDATWASFITTPPFPAYTSGHSTFSGGSARVLAHFYGTDDVAFDAPSDGLPGVTRSFTSLSQAAEEAGQSRIYGGIHWQYDNQGGLASGRALADHVFFNFLQPVAAPGTCNETASRLCLNGGRFQVEATWTLPDGSSGPAQGLAIGEDSGRFWFFSADNTELVVKVLNACGPFDRYWVFASGLTNVEVLITVTDTQAGRTRRYFNPQGKSIAAILDSAAFATCP
jgi:hypothetical protein